MCEYKVFVELQKITVATVLRFYSWKQIPGDLISELKEQTSFFCDRIVPLEDDGLT